MTTTVGFVVRSGTRPVDGLEARTVDADASWADAATADDRAIDRFIGTPTVGVAGSFYRLCWGHDPVNLLDYNVEVDAGAELSGPLVGDYLYCALGNLCEAYLDGYGFAMSNSIIVIERPGSCGDSSATIASGPFGANIGPYELSA